MPRAIGVRLSAWAVAASISVLPLFSLAAGDAPTLSAAQWLTRIQQAAKERSYAGVSVTSIGGAMTSTRLVHLVDGGQIIERAEVLDGEPQLTIRQGDQIHRLWPMRRLAVVEHSAPTLALPSAAFTVDPRLQQFYEVKVLGTDRIAGREAQLLWLRPRDELRFAQRLWVDVSTGLLLRSEVLGHKDEVLEAVGFSSLDLQVRQQAAGLLEPLRRLDGYRLVQRQSVATQLDAEGWVLTPTVAGFALVNCVRRVLGSGVPTDAGLDTPVLQAVFSDGLSNVSLFIERQDRRTGQRALQTQLGATHTVTQPLGADHWVTAMGDVPTSALKQFLKGLERRR